MDTPIVDFVKAYAESDVSRFHMPGHKGVGFLGCEAIDITEIHGADVLYAANGIIRESENNASLLFGTRRTLYSAEGSSLAIKAMLAQIKKLGGKRCRVVAARNAHRAFLYGCAMLDIDISWIFPERSEHICISGVTAQDVEHKLNAESEPPSAVYITSPDYLGNISDIAGIATVCHAHSVPLVVDNAHGAYRAFYTPSKHPIALGADMCCDSAHKTLPVLTGGAYLHISHNAEKELSEGIEGSLSAFASSSPSYLILQSLDLANRYLSCGYRQRLIECTENVAKLKRKLSSLGFSVLSGEELKLIVNANKCGYTGDELAAHLRKHSVEPEFSDLEYTVAMFTPETPPRDYARLLSALGELKLKAPLPPRDLSPIIPTSAMSAREALLSPQKILPISEAEGRICASPVISCPPAIPIVMCGEIVSREAIELMQLYKIEKISVVK